MPNETVYNCKDFEKYDLKGVSGITVYFPKESHDPVFNILCNKLIFDTESFRETAKWKDVLDTVYGDTETFNDIYKLFLLIDLGNDLRRNLQRFDEYKKLKNALTDRIFLRHSVNYLGRTPCEKLKHPFVEADFVNKDRTPWEAPPCDQISYERLRGEIDQALSKVQELPTGEWEKVVDGFIGKFNKFTESVFTGAGFRPLYEKDGFIILEQLGTGKEFRTKL